MKLCRHAVRGPARLAAMTAVLLALAGCSPLLVPLPPPPGALYVWQHVSPSEIPESRPLMPRGWWWDEMLFGTPKGGEECALDACRSDPVAWTARCLQPRAAAMAELQAQTLRTGDHWHPAALAVLAAPPAVPTAASDPEVCGFDWAQHAVGTEIIRAVGELAAREAAATCAAHPTQVTFDVHEIDRGSETFGQWLRHETPAIFGAAFIGIMSAATVVPMGDTVSRIVTVDVLVRGEDGRTQLFAVRGGASVAFGSGKAMENSTPPPPELVAVALGAALGRLDARLAAWTQAGCRLPP